jgi:hypothetical protein
VDAVSGDKKNSQEELKTCEGNICRDEECRSWTRCEYGLEEIS